MTHFLETERCILKLTELSDLDYLIKLRSDPEVMKYIGDGTTQTQEKVEEFLQITIPYQEKYGFGFCSVFEKKTGEFMGQAGLFHKGYHDEQPDIEVAYRLHKEFWGQGYGTELTKALIQWGFAHINIDKIVAVADPQNMASQNVLLKSGFYFKGKQSWWNGREIFYYEIYRVKVMPYNEKWQHIFTDEAKRIQEILGDNCIAIHHIGSTAVPGLSAKPIIDMIPIVKDILLVKKAVPAMEQLGYESKGEFGMLFRHFFMKREADAGFNIHVFEENTPDIERHLKFRDWMRAHPDDRDAYQKLKLDLARQFPNDIYCYVTGKDAFVETIDSKTGFDGLRLVLALKDKEWEAARNLRQKYFVDRALVKDKNHAHIILYQGIKIIGYAHIQFLPENRAALPIIVIDEPYRNQGYGKQFLQYVKRWLKNQGIHELQIESTQYCD